MYYPEEIIEEVRSRNNIVDVIGSCVHLQKRGKDYVGLCPFHNEKTPSFSVSPSKQMYRCFGCHASGNVFTFLMQYENISFVDSLKELAGRAGVALPEAEMTDEEKKEQSKRQLLLDIYKAAAEFYCARLQSDEGEQARVYLKSRGILEETQKKFGLGYAPKYGDSLYRFLHDRSTDYTDRLLKESDLVVFDEKNGAHDRFWNRVMFPIMDRNFKVIAFGSRVMVDAKPKYLNSSETALFSKSINLYGINYAKSSRKPYLIMCEGYMDVISLWQAGITNAVASLGTSLTEKQCDQLKRYTKEVRLAYDYDEAGLTAAHRAISLLKSKGLSVRIIHMEPCNDPDEFIRNMGAEAFEKRADESEDSFMFEVSLMEKDYRQSDSQGRSAFLNAVAKKLLEFPQEMERNVYIEAVSARYGISPEVLRRAVNSFGASMTTDERGGTVNTGTAGNDFYPRKNRYVSDSQAREDAVLSAEKMILMWMTDDPGIIDKIKDYITADDFKDRVYKLVASLIFEEYGENKSVNPASVVSRFDNAEDQKQAAELFAPANGDDLKGADKSKALNEAVRRIKNSSLDEAMRSASDGKQLQKIIEEKAKLQKLNIRVD